MSSVPVFLTHKAREAGTDEPMTPETTQENYLENLRAEFEEAVVDRDQGRKDHILTMLRANEYYLLADKWSMDYDDYPIHGRRYGNNR